MKNMNNMKKDYKRIDNKCEELQTNNEADCRQGKYKAILKFKDVATMQEISITLNIERANNSVQLTIDA